MRDPASAHALDRMIDDLASLDASDARAILNLLDEDARGQVVALLARRAGQAEIFPAQPGDDPENQLSEWLRDRIGTRGAMTRVAHDVLLAAGREIFGPVAALPSSRRTGPSLLARMGSTLAGRDAR